MPTAAATERTDARITPPQRARPRSERPAFRRYPRARQTTRAASTPSRRVMTKASIMFRFLETEFQAGPKVQDGVGGRSFLRRLLGAAGAVAEDLVAVVDGGEPVAAD